MTDPRMAFAELLEKGGDADFLKDLLAFALQRLMDMEAEVVCGAGLHARSAERVNSRNGYRDRWGGGPIRLNSGPRFLGVSPAGCPCAIA
jgi:transposase-like protein